VSSIPRASFGRRLFLPQTNYALGSEGTASVHISIVELGLGGV